MIFPLFRRRARTDTISGLYGTIVAQARLPRFYQDYAIPDTVNGRFDLIVLHLVLVLERIAADPALREVGQGLFDRFWQDMDHNLREMGVGDLAVPRRMRELGEAYYGRAQAYRAALGAGDAEALAGALARNVHGVPGGHGGHGVHAVPDAPRRLAAYMQEAARGLGAQDAADLAAGRLRFPDPAPAAAAAGQEH
jgi:cytochrome b pre-mRNA-processing protein 3